MIIASVDPGTCASGFVAMEVPSFKMIALEILDNEVLLDRLRVLNRDDFQTLVIERVASYGMAVGESVFQTCFWTGRMIEAWHPGETELITRIQIKNTLCHSSKAKDSNVNQAVRDVMSAHFGIPEKCLKGTKKSPGPLYGIKSHMWSALAAGIAWVIENKPTIGTYRS